ncbi:MAG: DNA gyrase/topoisomerase IV subunit A [Bacteroidales bacterium]|nr:DNA gyrase/topoisomerase IV subunit A [Bacteroidales bacterium]
MSAIDEDEPLQDLSTSEEAAQPQDMEHDAASHHGDTPSDGEVISLNAMFKDYWIDYASDVILDRSVPDIDDGLKPVQRRILHAMKEMDDGRYNKVANIVGATMAYHPHGDASIKDALVNMGQKDLLIDCQGNWGNILTGDDAAAGRYIEARLSQFAKDVVFNAKTTQWKPSYDGRHQEPVSLPIKFPLLLAQGTKGIAVTLQSVILPYNFCELLEASISILKDEPFTIYPDFPTGGLIDVSRYNDGAQGGRLRIRAKMHYDEKRKAIVITEIPYGVTTDTLIDSIAKANEKGKIKIKRIDDNTAAQVEVVINLPSGVSPDQTIDALYAFTQCQVSFSPQTCVIIDQKPSFVTASEILRHSTHRTVELLKRELEIRLDELQQDWHRVSLERIFFEQGIYKIMEKKTYQSWEEQVDAMERAFDPYRKSLRREVTRDDVLRLCGMPVRKISRFDIKKAMEELASIEAEIEEVSNHLEHLTDYAIAYFRHILKRYGAGRERRTEVRDFEDIEAVSVAMATEKLYVNAQTGFAGYGLKREEGVSVVGECSKLDDIIAFRRDGTYIITRVQEKCFVGSNDCKELIHVAVFRKNDERTVYNLIYRDGAFGYSFVKRFTVTSVIRDREYNLTRATKGTRVLYLTANPNGEAEVVTIHHVSKPHLKKTSFDFDFAQLAIKGKSAMGNIITRNAVRNITLKGEGVSTLGARKIWFDESVKRLNVNEAGVLLGEFKGKDRILSLMQSGYVRTTNFDLANHFDDDLVAIRKYNPATILTIVYREASSQALYIKRFLVEELDKKLAVVDVEAGDALLLFSFDTFPKLQIDYDTEHTGKKIASEDIDVADYIAVKGYKAKGKRLTTAAVKDISWLPSAPEPEPDAANEEEPEADNLSADEMGMPEGEQTSLF